MSESNNNRLISVPFTAICIDDSVRPREIPLEKWLKKGNEYTIVHVVQLPSGKLGFVLKEITLGDDTFPYYYFGAHRFGIPLDDLEAEKAVAELLTEQNLWQNVEK